MPKKLKNLKITKVDFVTAGANPDADISLTKSRTEEGDAAPQSFDETFQQQERRREMDRIADDMWNLCFALNDSLCSILFDKDADAERKRAALEQSFGEFSEAVREAFPEWTNGQAVGFVAKTSDGDAARALAKALERITKPPDRKPDDNGTISEAKGETNAMNIDKSKLTPEELATLDAIEKKAGIPDEPPVSEPNPSPEPASVVTKSAPDAPSESIPADDGEDIYKGMSPAVRQEFEALRKFRQDAEDNQLREVAQGYAILGENPEKLFGVLKSLKATNADAYAHMIATLDSAKIAVEKSGAFGEIGKTGNGATGGGAVKETESKALELMKSRKDLTMAQTIDEVLQADPELAKRYETED